MPLGKRRNPGAPWSTKLRNMWSLGVLLKAIYKCRIEIIRSASKTKFTFSEEIYEIITTHIKNIKLYIIKSSL